MDERLIFPLQNKHVHSSSIVELPNGDFLACWFYGSGERSSDDVQVQGARLRKGSDTWGPVFTMADTPDIPDCNPVLFLDNQERLWLFWIVVHTNRWERSILKYRRTSDYNEDGPPNWEWQDIIILKPGVSFQEDLRAGFKALKHSESMWAEYALPYSRMLIEAAGDPFKRQAGWMTRTKPVTLDSGRILLPLYSDGFNASITAYSDDDGNTWTPSKPMVGLGPIQPTLAVKKNGDIVAYCRDSGGRPGRAMKSTSTDDGATWSLALDSEIPNPGSSLAITTLADGRWVLVYNDTESGRHQLAVALSEDEGTTWPWKRYLDKSDARNGSYSYPTLIQASDGTLHATYSFKESGAAIKHKSFSVDWIKKAAD
jgi:predicted neuraminidase